MEKSDFTEEELSLLETIFKMADVMVEDVEKTNYGCYDGNILYNLKNKLGIYDLVGTYH